MQIGTPQAGTTDIEYSGETGRGNPETQNLAPEALKEPYDHIPKPCNQNLTPKTRSPET